MAFEQCALSIEASLGRPLTKAEREFVERRTASILQGIAKSAKDPEEFLSEVLAKEKESLAVRKLAAKRRTLLNQKAQEDLTDYVKTHWSDDLGGGLLAWVKGLNVDRFGARDSAAAQAGALRHAKVASFVSDLKSEDLIEIAQSGELDLEIRQAAAAMDAKEDVGRFTEAAVALAKLYRKHGESARLDLVGVGYQIGKLAGWVAPQTHDMFRVAKGGSARDLRMGAEEAFEKWRDFVSQHLDFEQSFLSVPAAERKAILRSLWTQFSTGKHLVFGEGPRDRSIDRSLVFKSPEAEQAYFEEYGIGESLFESMVHHLDSAGRNVALARRLGPSGESNLRAVFDVLEKELNQEGKFSALEKLRKDFRVIQRRVWPVVSGEAHISDSIALSSASETALNMQRMADLGGMMLASFNDINNAAATADFFGYRTARNYVAETNKVAAELVTGVGKGTSRSVEALAAENRILLEGMHAPLSNSWADSDVPGAAAKMTQLAFKYFGASWWQNRLRVQSMLGTIARYGLHADLPADKLPEGMQAALRQYGIDASDWDVIRSAEKQTYLDTPVLSTRQLYDLTDAQLAKHPSIVAQQPLDEEGLERAARKLRTALADKYGAMVADISDQAITAPSAFTRSLATQGLRRGTLLGELTRHAVLFKTYTMAYMSRHLGRALYSYHPDRVGIAKAVARMVMDPQSNQTTALAGLIAGGIFWGAVSNAAIEVSQGKRPRVPLDADSAAKVMRAAFVRSGALGIYGDLVSAQVNESTSGSEYLFELLAPPSLKRGRDLAVNPMLDVALNRWDDDSARRLFKAYYNTVPGRNLFYTRWLTDATILNNVQEHLNPGYLDRLERFNENELGYEYFVPPSAAVEALVPQELQP